MAVKEENGVFLVWSSSTRARQSRNRRNCNHSATIEVQEAPSGTRTSLTSVQGALAVLLVASQLVAFVQLPEAHGGSESAPAAGAGPAGAAAGATAVAAAPGRKMTSSGSSSSSTEATEAASGGSGGSSRNNGSSNGSSSTRTRSSIRIKSSIRASISLSSTTKGYGSRVWIRGMDQGYGSCSIMGYGSGYGSWSMDRVWVRDLDPCFVFLPASIYYIYNIYIYTYTYIYIHIGGIPHSQTDEISAVDFFRIPIFSPN